MRETNSPEHWEMISLEDVASVFDKKRVPLNESQRQQMQGEYPYCGANGVVDYVNDYIFDGEYNGPQYSGQELSKKYRLTAPCKWRIENVNQTDSAHCEIQVSNCR